MLEVTDGKLSNAALKSSAEASADIETLNPSKLTVSCPPSGRGAIVRMAASAAPPTGTTWIRGIAEQSADDSVMLYVELLRVTEMSSI